ncbi:hypothetical protein L2E82_16722 [Cichorium intybus]|uniref:Uncharacterized protein n=1 Tax=Cichorium intybus TaxID=13427 RepID=A0ACB9F7A4_CICIN|nr:hypothetical protein L2E82_16722 [Cichorium intybus]
MGNSMSQRVNSSSSSSDLGFSFSNSVTGYLTGVSKPKSIFIPKQSTPAGLAVIFQEIIPFNSNSDFIVFPPPLIAIHLLYSAPGELWNWDHPKPRDFPANHTISAFDRILIPTSPDDVIHSEEYTCVVSNKDGYPSITHLYGDTVVDCHPIPESMAVTAFACGNDDPPVYRGEPSDNHLSVEFSRSVTYAGKISSK